MAPAEAVQALKQLRGMIQYFSSDCVDDPEDVLADMVGSSDELKAAIDLAIERMEDDRAK